jgi:CBS domain-containing protein
MAGIFTAKDFLRKVVVPRHDATKVSVCDLMSRSTICAHPGFSILDCARLMLTQYVVTLRAHVQCHCRSVLPLPAVTLWSFRGPAVLHPEIFDTFR